MSEPNKIPSVRLTQRLKYRIINDLKSIIPSKYEADIEEKKTIFLSDLLIELDKDYPVEDMNVLKKYLDSEQYFGNYASLINGEEPKLTINIVKMIPVSEYNNLYPDQNFAYNNYSRFQSRQIESPERISIYTDIRFGRFIFGKTERFVVHSSNMSYYNTDNRKLDVTVLYNKVIAEKSKLAELTKEFFDLYVSHQKEKEEIYSSYRHIVETSTTLGKLVDAVPELRDGLHKILNKYQCGSSNDEDQTMKKILEYRQKNNIVI